MTNKKKIEGKSYFDFPGGKPISVLKNSKIILANILKNKEVNFKPIYLEPDKIIFVLVGKEAIMKNVDGHKEILVPFVLKDYYLGLGVTFLKRLEGFLFSGISLKINKLTSKNIFCLFRAEWDRLKDTNNIGDFVHAQPHWHINQLFIKEMVAREEKNIFIGGEEMPQEFLEITESKIPRTEYFDTSRFHFAMASEWHNEGSHQIKLEDENSLSNWLDGCLRYIMEQLTYMSDHKH